MATKKKQLADAVAEAVGAGKPVALETVDFNDPNRPKTCLEVDFPILPVNQVAIIEGNAGKPIYQMSKWWARRRSSVFRSMLIAAATKAPEDPAQAAKLVWDNYYANHHGYAATGLFHDASGEEAVFLKATFKNGRGVAGNVDPGPFVPPVAMPIHSPHGTHLLSVGRRKWRSQGGYPTLAHGGLSLLEVLSPYVELSR